MIAVCAAMARELAALERRLVNRETAVAGGYPLRLGYLGANRLLLCRTGVGRRAEGALRSVRDSYAALDAVLSVGVCGALNPGFKTGDLILCESVRGDPSLDADSSPIPADERLMGRALAAAAGQRLWVGQSLTVDRVVSEPADKGSLRKSTGLDVVEMESYWIGLTAREKGLPFLAARVVLDEAADALPELPGVVEPGGSLRTLPALSFALKRPGRVPWLLRTALRERRALANLSRFLAAFVGALEVSTVAEPA